MNSQSRQNFQLIWMIATIVCAVTAVFFTFFVSCSRVPESSPADDPAAAMAVVNDFTATAEQNDLIRQPITGLAPAAAAPETAPVILAETADLGPEYISSFVFVGDSTTYGMGAYDALPWTQVWTPSSGTLNLSNQSYSEIEYYNPDGSKQEMTIKEAVTMRQPEYLVITLGINGISYMSEEQFKAEYTDLIETVRAVSPNTKIICQSIFPVIDSADAVSSDIGNDRINMGNQWVLAVATQTGTRYLSTCDILKDATGNLREDYCNGDGIHLNGNGCQAVLQYIRTHGYK